MPLYGDKPGKYTIRISQQNCPFSSFLLFQITFKKRCPNILPLSVFERLYNLWNMSKLDVTEMVEMIYARRFGLVIFRAQFYPPPVLQAIGQNYDVVEHIEMNGFLYAILRPRPRVGV